VIALLANVVQNNQNTLLEAVTVGIVKKNTLPASGGWGVFEHHGG
jgi:hypothetical protein